MRVTVFCGGSTDIQQFTPRPKEAKKEKKRASERPGVFGKEARGRGSDEAVRGGENVHCIR